MGSGLVYTLIGIKNRWIQIFLSVTYLVSLSVTVLIIYVMNPPVRNAIQGAYFVAALLTGITFGAGALIFKEVTEGLGCLLGGFCLSMWLLTLKAGGLIPSASGKGILVAAFTVCAYALSCSHYTRPYALIGSTSFAGGTVVVLGIDCFSRAGLKEFWAYIWNLNDNVFPLNTNTYPLTRGIRVEIAVIVLICLVGIVSQMKLWKVIRDRREQRDAIQLDDDRERDQMEEQIGRTLETNNHLERTRWERVYGDRDGNERHTSTTDSGLGTDESLQKGSVSVRDAEEENASVESIALRDLSAPNDKSKRQSTSKAQDPVPIHEVKSKEGLKEQHESGRSPPDVQQSKSKDKDIDHKRASGISLTGQDPPVVPLPFTIPISSGSIPASVASSVDSDAETDPDLLRVTPRASGNSLIRRLSGRSQQLPQASQSEEALIVPYTKSSPGFVTCCDNRRRERC